MIVISAKRNFRKPGQQFLFLDFAAVREAGFSQCPLKQFKVVEILVFSILMEYLIYDVLWWTVIGKPQQWSLLLNVAKEDPLPCRPDNLCMSFPCLGMTATPRRQCAIPA